MGRREQGRLVWCAKGFGGMLRMRASCLFPTPLGALGKRQGRAQGLAGPLASPSESLMAPRLHSHVITGRLPAQPSFSSLFAPSLTCSLHSAKHSAPPQALPGLLLSVIGSTGRFDGPVRCRSA